MLESRLLLTQAAHPLSLLLADQQKRKRLALTGYICVSDIDDGTYSNNDSQHVETLFDDYQSALVETDDLSALAANPNQKYELIHALDNISQVTGCLSIQVL